MELKEFIDKMNSGAEIIAQSETHLKMQSFQRFRPSHSKGIYQFNEVEYG